MLQTLDWYILTKGRRFDATHDKRKVVTHPFRNKILTRATYEYADMHTILVWRSGMPLAAVITSGIDGVNHSTGIQCDAIMACRCRYTAGPVCFIPRQISAYASLFAILISSFFTPISVHISPYYASPWNIYLPACFA